jgi:hypothetical protein
MGFLFFDGGRGNKTPLGLYLTKSLANALNYLEIEMMSIFEINFFTCLISYLNEYVTWAQTKATNKKTAARIFMVITDNTDTSQTRIDLHFLPHSFLNTREFLIAGWKLTEWRNAQYRNVYRESP